MPVVLEVENLTKSFRGVAALAGVSLVVEDRGIHSIIGPNGAGKSTLFNCVSGHMRPDGGRVIFLGQDITGARPVPLVRHGLSRTFQVNSIFPMLTVLENVQAACRKTSLGRRFGLWDGPAARRAARQDAQTLLAEIGLGQETWRQPAGQLSHGDRRALEIAIALACRSKLLCLDEPAAGMGVGETDNLSELIQRIARNVAVLLVEHRMSMVLAISHAVTVMRAGRVLAQGPPDEISRNEDVRSAYLGRPISEADRR